MDLNEVMWRLSRAARELLGWTQDEAAERAGVSGSAVKKYENRKSQSVGMLNTLRYTYETAGIEFILSDKPGVERLGVVLNVPREESEPEPPKKPARKA